MTTTERNAAMQARWDLEDAAKEKLRAELEAIEKPNESGMTAAWKRYKNEIARIQAEREKSGGAGE